MDTFMGRYRNITFLGAVIIFQILGLAIQIKRRSENDSSRLIRLWTVSAVTPLEKAIVGLQTGTGNIWHNYIYLRGVRQENRDLREKIERLQLEQVRLRQDADQGRRLQSLLGFKEQFIDQTVAAQVIGSSGSEQSRTVYLDKGLSDGIQEGMPVISSQGIVGKIIQVATKHTSQVLLINDQTSGVGTILENSRLQGVLKGKASGELGLENVMAEEDVKPGERVLTSGGDLIFPKGLPVGTVQEVKRGTEFLQVTVRPATPLSHLEEVLVITKKQEREPEPAATSSVRAADILAQRLPSVPEKPVQVPAGTVRGNPGGSGSVSPKPSSSASVQPQGKPAISTTIAPSRPATGGVAPVTGNSLPAKTPAGAVTGSAGKANSSQSEPKANPAPTATAPPAKPIPQSLQQPETAEPPQ
jgi:rod shape-determining protein MreC